MHSRSIIASQNDRTKSATAGMAKGLLARANEMTTASDNSNLLANWLQSTSSRQTKKEVLAATTAGALELQQKQLEAGYEALQLEMDVQKQVARDKLLLEHRNRMDQLGQLADNLAITEVARTMEEKHRQLSRLDQMSGDEELIALKRQYLAAAFDECQAAIINRIAKPR